MKNDIIDQEHPGIFPAYYQSVASCNDDHGVSESVYNRKFIDKTNNIEKTHTKDTHRNDMFNIITECSKNNNNDTDKKVLEASSCPPSSSAQKQSKRKNSIARIGSALREIQNTITPRKIRHRKTTDCTFVEQPNCTNEITATKKSVKRAISLPNIKDNEKKNFKRNSLFRKLSRDHNTASIKKSIPKIDHSESVADIQKFPSNRLESYRNNKTFSNYDSFIFLGEEDEEEMKRINQRRKYGRSRSAQLSLSDNASKSLKKRDRSFSTDCDEFLFSFEALIEKRLNSSKETMLCSTDL